LSPHPLSRKLIETSLSLLCPSIPPPEKANTDKASNLYLVGVFRYISLDLIFIGGDDAKLHGITEDGVRVESIK